MFEKEKNRFEIEWAFMGWIKWYAASGSSGRMGFFTACRRTLRAVAAQKSAGPADLSSSGEHSPTDHRWASSLI